MSRCRIYGKRIYSNDIDLPVQKTFKALDQTGHRVNRLADAFVYAEESDAQEVIDKVTKIHKKQGIQICAFEIRKVK